MVRVVGQFEGRERAVVCLLSDDTSVLNYVSFLICL